MSSPANHYFLATLYDSAMDMGSRIRQLRLANDMTQDALAEICGVTKSAVSQWESNATKPTVDALLKASEHLSFSLDWLMNGTGAGPEGDMRTQQLLDLYRHLDERGKAAVFRVAESESSYASSQEDLTGRAA